MNIRYIPTWLGLLLTLYLVTACDRVYDDLSGCLGNTIVFSYLADDNQEHLQEYVDGIDVFIFDAKGEVLIEKIIWRENGCFHHWRSRFRKGIIKWWP